MASQKFVNMGMLWHEWDCMYLRCIKCFCNLLHGPKLHWHSNSDWCDIGVVRSENLKKLPALPAGSILAHYGVKSSCRGQQKHDRRRRREAGLAGVTFSLPRRGSLRWEGIQQLWAIARCWQQHFTILRDKQFYNSNILLLGVMYESIIKVSPFHFLNIWVIGQQRWRLLSLDNSLG